MNLREELNTFMVSRFANDCSVGEYEDRLVDIFKRWVSESIAEERAKINTLPLHDPDMKLEQKYEIIGYEKGLVRAQTLLGDAR